jgi:hypothetical protein
MAMFIAKPLAGLASFASADYASRRGGGKSAYGAGDTFAEFGDSFLGDLRSLFFPNKSPMSKKLM